jgi:hypothetical protein
LKDIKLDHQDFSNFKNTTMKIHTKFIYFFLVSSIIVCGQTQEIKDTKAISFASKEASLEALKNHKFEYEVTNLRSLNSKSLDFGVTEFANPLGENEDADIDDDGDGQSNIDEISFGTDPLDSDDVPLDTDSDGTPDCEYMDDDNDDISDGQDNCPMTYNP